MSTISVVEGEDLLVYLDAEEETPKSDAIKPKKPGGDLLVYLEGVDETPKSAVINSKKTIAQLQEKSLERQGLEEGRGFEEGQGFKEGQGGNHIATLPAAMTLP
jgi:hypothetical protein